MASAQDIYDKARDEALGSTRLAISSTYTVLRRLVTPVWAPLPAVLVRHRVTWGSFERHAFDLSYYDWELRIEIREGSAPGRALVSGFVRPKHVARRVAATASNPLGVGYAKVLEREINPELDRDKVVDYLQAFRFELTHRRDIAAYLARLPD
jgi:hypothetical protein